MYHQVLPPSCFQQSRWVSRLWWRGIFVHFNVVFEYCFGCTKNFLVSTHLMVINFEYFWWYLEYFCCNLYSISVNISILSVYVRLWPFYPICRVFCNRWVKDSSNFFFNFNSCRVKIKLHGTKIMKLTIIQQENKTQSTWKLQHESDL